MQMMPVMDKVQKEILNNTLMKKDQEVLIVMKRAPPLIFLHCFAVEVRNIKFLV